MGNIDFPVLRVAIVFRMNTILRKVSLLFILLISVLYGGRGVYLSLPRCVPVHVFLAIWPFDRPSLSLKRRAFAAGVYPPLKKSPLERRPFTEEVYKMR